VRHHVVLACLTAAFTSGCGTSPEFREEVIETEVEEYVPAGQMRSLKGRWKGMGEQSNGSSWDIVLDVKSLNPGKCATIVYPSSGCSGYWMCTSSFDGVQLDAVEHITDGKDRCVDKVDVQLVVNDGGRTLSFYASTGDIKAEGRLARE
jgi:hypothetical protein